MSDLARFRLGFNGMFVSDIDGDWVSYRGHADAIARLTYERDALFGKLAEVLDHE